MPGLRMAPAKGGRLNRSTRLYIVYGGHNGDREGGDCLVHLSQVVGV